MIGVIRDQLLKIVDNIDSGNSNISEEESIEVVKVLRKYTRKDTPMSKYQAYTYLNMSRAKFDNLVSEGKLPKGIKTAGYKELSWYKKDLDKYIEKYEKERIHKR